MIIEVVILSLLVIVLVGIIAHIQVSKDFFQWKAKFWANAYIELEDEKLSNETLDFRLLHLRKENRLLKSELRDYKNFECEEGHLPGDCPNCGAI